MRRVVVGAFLAAVTVAALAPRHADAQGSRPHSPVALVLSPDAARVYVAESDGRRLVALNAADGKVLATLPLPGEATGLARDKDGKRLFVTVAIGAAARAIVVDPASLKATATWPVGYGACAPVVSPDGNTLCLCNRWTNSVSLLDTRTGRERAHGAAVREPVAADITPDGSKLFVANLLPDGGTLADVLAASVTVLDVANGKTLATIRLLDGSTSVRGVAVSPDGSMVYVSHVLSRFHQPTTQLERGWMNTNALTLIDPTKLTRAATVLLDEVDKGAANPWAVACTPDGKRVVVTHSGLQEVSVIDRAALAKKLEKADLEVVPDDLAFLLDVRDRVPVAGEGPRCVAVTDSAAWTAGFFGDSVGRLDLTSHKTVETKLQPAVPETLQRKGERLFADANMCFQQWQSCVTCHPDARVDGLNWDLLNDGLGNPKNTKNMLYAHRTPPSMSLGVRASAQAAVRAGIRFIQFAVRPEEDAQAIDAYLEALVPQPSPALVNGKLSPAAARGKVLFESTAVGCAVCHSGELYTDLKPHEMGTGEGLDSGKPFYTPHLRETWRTGPFLHDGRAGTLKELLTQFNPGDKHGHTSQLSPQQLADLIAYVESL